MLQPIAIDTNSFPELRKGQCVYVDKTAYFHRLITRFDARRFFLARPRRFGKSLMITTLQAIFEGRRELFDGLDISRTDWKWEKYPVLYFNMGFAASSISFEEFRRNFQLTIRRSINTAGWTYDENETPAGNFGIAIDELPKANDGRGVVILIDEYDDPVAQLLAKPDEAEKVRECLADFYHQMKDRAEMIRFLMITGVSKFTKMSVFSALSNLVDLSFEDEYATMLGYTEKELDSFFGKHTRAHAQKMGLSYEEYRAELKRWFNGYRFGRECEDTVYNPVSIGMNLALPKRRFLSCWSSTGKASMLMNFLKRQEFLGIDMDRVQNVRERDFDVSDIRALRTVPMLFQTGYLTIKDYDFRRQSYTLGVPDVEVRQDLATLITSVIANQDSTWVSQLSDKMLDANWDAFFTGLKSLYAAMPYGPKEGNIQEYSFERVLLTLLWSQAIYCRTEDRQANGQADIVAEHPCGIYIFELKVDEPVEAALEQVRRKGYDAPYRAKGLPIWLVGLSFDRQTRQLLYAKAEKVV
ncbi:MAG: AAA family ATPase [Victivallales bacterium]|nr:AAA family ATPase [Victivallales bacterium]